MNVATERGTSPGLDAGVEIRETHTGIVTMVGDRAYKVKKPIATDFLDFRSTECRQRVCEREVALNRRLAPDSYLGVAQFHGVEGQPPEPVIVMRRYPDGRRLSAMVRRGDDVGPELAEIAAKLSCFHARSARSRRIDASAETPAITMRWHTNLSELRRFSAVPPQVISEIERLATQYIAGRVRLFESRIRDRRVVDGHGDLLTDDIFCQAEGPVILDCLEFDDRLRYVDGIDDACFLAMDLEFLGRSDLSVKFLEHYRRGAAETAPASLSDFYIAYRAMVRAKVDCIRDRQGQRGAAADARRHSELALRHLQAATVRLIVVGGGPGTGKTTLARALAQRCDARVLSTDDVRQELRASGEIIGAAGVYNQGLYNPLQVDTVYDTILQRASELLAGGRSVILDGTWRDPRHRQRARDLGLQSHCPTVELECTVVLTEAQQRIHERRNDTSDATGAIAAAIAGETGSAGWSSAHRIDTGRPLGESVAEAQQVCCCAL